jgi:hypothetical protein
MSAASAQFASERAAPVAPAPSKPAASPALPGGVVPVGATTTSGTKNQVLPSGFVLPDPRRKEPLAPVPSSIDEAAPPHPWAVKPEHGGWMILVKSYTGSESRKLAERLATDIRQTHKVAAYLFERNGEERRAERERLEALRKAEIERNKPFREVMKQAQKEAELNGSKFIDETPTIKIPRPYHETPEQWAVLIGGFDSMEAARKALDTVKKLPAPKDVTLLDSAMIGGEEKSNARENGTEWKSAVNYLNPYACAMVVPNPASSKLRHQEKTKLEPFVVELNRGLENSLLTAKKPWTLLVKSYSTPMRVEGRGGNGSVFDKKISPGSSGADILRATAAEAELLTKALRNPAHKPRPYEAFVLHHRTGSIVTIGEFDSPDDPELLRVLEELKSLTYTPLTQEQKPELGPDGRPKVLRLFDCMAPIQVPKH